MNRAAPSLSASLRSLTQNPCHSKLVNGLYGTSAGMMARLRSDFALPLAAGTCGYFFWDPTFHNSPGVPANIEEEGVFQQAAGQAGFTRTCNMVYFETNTPDLAPVVSGLGAGTAFAFGSIPTPAVAATNTAIGLRDPAFQLLKESMVADARTHAACVLMQYTGKVDDIAGNWASVIGVDAKMLLTGAPNGLPLSVNDLFTLVNEDLQSFTSIVTKPAEVLFRPGRHSSHFQTEHEGVFHNDTSLTVDTKVDSDPKGGPSEGLIGFIWRNMPAGNNLLNFRTVKVVEWQPRVGVGMQTEQPTAAISDMSEEIGAAVVAARHRKKHPLAGVPHDLAQMGGEVVHHGVRLASKAAMRHARKVAMEKLAAVFGEVAVAGALAL